MGLELVRVASPREGGAPGEAWWFWCAGCNTHHAFTTKLAEGAEGPVWAKSGPPERPTFEPSLLCRDLGCHLLLRGGMLEYLGDCAHALAGKRVPIPREPL